MALTLRGVKQTPLTHIEMDNNLVFLNDNLIDSVTGTGNTTLTLTKKNSSVITVDLSHAHTVGQLPDDITVMSNYDTDDLSEGENNLYFTTDRIDNYLSAGTGISYLDGAISVDEANVNHDTLQGYMLNKHINHAAVDIFTSGILSGGGDLTESRTITLNHSDVDHNQTTNYDSDEHFKKEDITTFYQPDGTNPFVYTDNAGALHIDGNIIQNGSTYEVNVESITSTQELIITRYDAIAAISTGDISGMKVTKYDGTNDLIFGTDFDGYFKVGEEDSLQILATREDTPNNTSIPFWNNTAKRFDTDSNLTWNGSILAVGGDITATGDITAYFSDERLKNFSGKIENALDKINLLNGYYFTENDLAKSFGFSNNKRQVGLSAQEVEKILPEVVTEAPFDIEQDENGNEFSKSGENYKTLYYDKLVPLLVEAIKDLSLQIKELKNGTS
jgi:hypothetical protein